MEENTKQLLEDKLLERASGGNSNPDGSPHYFDCLNAIYDGDKPLAWDIYHEYCDALSDLDKEDLEFFYFEKFHSDIRDDDPPLYEN